MKKLIITLVVIAAVAASVGGYYYTRPGPEPKVTTAAVTRGDVVESVGATGTFEAITSVTVGSQVSGTIQEWSADFNSIVKKGQVIARIDPSLLQTQLEQSQANLVRAQADVERLRVSLDDAKTKLTRARGLFQRQLLTQADLDTAEVNVKSTDAQLKSSQASLVQAEASVNQNKVNIEHTIITAPIDGIVVSRSIDVGQTVAASFNAPTLFIIAADLTKMKCTANIDESDVGRIRTGQHVRIRVDAYPNEEFSGTVAQVRLQPVTVQNVVTYGTVIEVPNPEFKLKPGMTANVTIEVSKRTDVIRVPNAATRFRPSAEIFAALGQPVPPELQRGTGRGGAMAGGQGMNGQAATGAQANRGGAPGGQQAQAAPGSSQARGQATPGGQQAQAAPGGQARGQGAQGQSAQAQPGAGMAGRPFERGGGDRPQGQGQGMAQGGTSQPGQSGQGEQGGRGGVGPGGQSGQGGRGFDPNDPERRARMMERLQQMPPDQREQFIARMKERGINIEMPPAGKTGAKPAAKTGQDGMAASGAQTIDSLFGPLPPRISFGRAWIYTPATKQLKSVRLRLGVTDGTWTELLDGEIQPGQELVTGIIIGDEGMNRGTTGANSPLMQRGGPMGGRGPGGH